MNKNGRTAVSLKRSKEGNGEKYHILSIRLDYKKSVEIVFEFQEEDRTFPMPVRMFIARNKTYWYEKILTPKTEVILPPPIEKIITNYIKDINTNIPTNTRVTVQAAPILLAYYLEIFKLRHKYEYNSKRNRKSKRGQSKNISLIRPH